MKESRSTTFFLMREWRAVRSSLLVLALVEASTMKRDGGAGFGLLLTTKFETPEICRHDPRNEL